MTPEQACEKIHEQIHRLPALGDPGKVAFQNGVYFYFEKGEACSHAGGLRIVRVGSHTSPGGLVRRLQTHYRPNKNSSAFRKMLGGAILRSRMPDGRCLFPGPGKGHWEKQGAKVCESCAPIEGEVTNYLRLNTRFRCLHVPDKWLAIEDAAIATISFCKECAPSAAWLGRHSYSKGGRAVGLWESKGTDKYEFIADQKTIDWMTRCVDATLSLL